MFSLIWLIPAIPLAGFLVLAVGGAHLTRKSISAVGVSSIGLSASIAIGTALQFFAAPPAGHAITQQLWTIFNINGLRANVAFHLDALSLLMVLVITIIGFLIHVYSTGYMREERDYARFFAYMNLFIAAMLVLVLADNLFLLFVGWEGVGLCSYLLIGFWYHDPKNGAAATKAFLVTRVGDVFLAIGIFLFIANLGTLHIATLSRLAPEQWAVGSSIAIAASLLLLGGALGKSGQLPLQVWLPDAMAGPTPVSALIHAATMVTAGVYLIARMHVVFNLAPSVMFIVALIGGATLLLAGSCALVQRDIKRALAYSTISQIGYMFLALGVGAWSAAMFHFMTHAVFKALLFMGAGAVIVALHHEQDLYKMGGLRHRLPVVYFTFLVGAASISAIPLVTAGFYSKDMILYEVWASDKGGALLWTVGFIGAFITAVYSFRIVFLAFHGEAKSSVKTYIGKSMTIPLVLLAIAATFVGFLEIPRTLLHAPVFSHFLETVLPYPSLVNASVSTELVLQIASAGIVFAGIGAAYLVSRRTRSGSSSTYLPAGVHALLLAGFGFDWLYDRLIVAPFILSARANRNDAIDFAYTGAVQIVEEAAYAARLTQSGRLRWYAAGIGIGAVIAVAVVVYI